MCLDVLRSRKARPEEPLEVVDAFLTALRRGDFDALVAVLDPDIVVRIDSTAAAPGAPSEIRGAKLSQGSDRFRARCPIGTTGARERISGSRHAPRGGLFRAFNSTIAHGKIVQVEVIADPEHLRQLDLAVLND